MSQAIDIKVPDIGDFKDVPVIEIYVKVGDTVKAEDPLVSLESDKATMDVPAPRGGVVKAILAKIGDTVSEGSVIMQFADDAAASPEETVKPSVSAPPSPVSAPAGRAEVRIPDIGDFKDVPVIEIYVKVGDTVKAEDPLVSLESDKAAAVAAGRLRQVRRGRAQGPVAHQEDLGREPASQLGDDPARHHHDDADITELEAFRVTLNKELYEKSGVKVTMLAFLIKACVAALKKFPEFNASLDGDTLVLKKYFHIGFAADTPNGLMVPVIRDADKKGVCRSPRRWASSRPRRATASWARRHDRRLLLDQLAGRHRRHLLHAHHQRARSGDPGRLQERHQAGVGRQGLPAAPDPAAVAVVGPPRHRRRVRRALQHVPRTQVLADFRRVMLF
jgi:pyruvate dehydrogenase E2 component (dihydrolipoamide acetyltransferase)